MGMEMPVWAAAARLLQQLRTEQDSESSVLSRFSRVWLSAISRTVTRWAPLSMGFPRQEFWSGLPFPPPGHDSHPGIEPASLISTALPGRFLTTSATREARTKKVVLVCMLSRVQLFTTPRTIACQAPMSMEFSRQGYWSSNRGQSLYDSISKFQWKRGACWWTTVKESVKRIELGHWILKVGDVLNEGNCGGRWESFWKSGVVATLPGAWNWWWMEKSIFKAEQLGRNYPE